MHYYLAAFFVNEFEDNSSAIPSSSPHKYDDLESNYGYSTTLVQSFFILLILGYAYKMMWLFSLKHREILSTGSLPLKRAFKAAKKRMKKLMKAGLRFSKKREDGYVLEPTGDEIEMSDEEDRHDAVYDDEDPIKDSPNKSSKKRGSVGEEMVIREDGLLLFGVMEPSSDMKSINQQQQLQQQQQQYQQSQQSHHSVLNALYRPEYIQTPQQLNQSPNYRNSTTTSSLSPSSSSTTTKNRIVVSKSSQKNLSNNSPQQQQHHQYQQQQQQQSNQLGSSNQDTQNTNNIQNSFRI